MNEELLLLAGAPGAWRCAPFVETHCSWLAQQPAQVCAQLSEQDQRIHMQHRLQMQSLVNLIQHKSLL